MLKRYEARIERWDGSQTRYRTIGTFKTEASAWNAIARHRPADRFQTVYFSERAPYGVVYDRKRGYDVYDQTEYGRVVCTMNLWIRVQSIGERGY